MKRITLLTILMAFMLQTMGQQISIFDANLKWNIGTHCVNEGPMDPYNKWSTSYLHVEGDTVMNEKYYKKLVNCEDSLCTKENLKSYIREEAGKVYLSNKTEELIQFDFNLQAGQGMIMDFLLKIGARYFVKVDSVKTIKFQDQKERIAQYVTVFDYHEGTVGEYSVRDIFVEGIGSLKFGLEYPINLFITADRWCSPNLLCTYQGKDLIYADQKINNCNLTTGIHPIKQPDLLKAYINSHGTLEIQLEETKGGKLFVFDINGKQVFGQVVNHSTSQICLPCSGLYFYRFESDKGHVQIGKVWMN